MENRKIYRKKLTKIAEILRKSEDLSENRRKFATESEERGGYGTPRSGALPNHRMRTGFSKMNEFRDSKPGFQFVFGHV